MKKQRICIVGAGISGLTTCKHLLVKGFHPTVFEAGPTIGGVWAHTLSSTRLQSPKIAYQFTDFPWPDYITDTSPTHSQIMDYLYSYAQHFDLFPNIRFDTEVLGVDYVGAPEEEVMAWDLWGGSGHAFGGSGEWHITVKHDSSTSVLQFDFLVLCMGLFSRKPRLPTFPAGKGTEVFDGRVLHSKDCADMGSESMLQLVKGKRVTVVGYLKSALDIAAECADANGSDYPCTLICRTKRWNVPQLSAFGIPLGFFYGNRFSEFLIHKPGEGIFLSLLATLLSPLPWIISKLIEAYFEWTTPMKKFRMVPEHSFFKAISSCVLSVLPEKFYQRLEEGSIVLKYSRSFTFRNNGVILEDETSPIESEVVIFATGYKSDENLRGIFMSPFFQNLVVGSQTTLTSPLYRECIHPRIPQLAVVGNSESVSNLHTSEMRAKWLAHFLDGKFQLLSIRNMEKDVIKWEKFMKRYTLGYYKRISFGICQIWFNDQLCKDMGYNPMRKKGLISELFSPYCPIDYAEI